MIKKSLNSEELYFFLFLHDPSILRELHELFVVFLLRHLALHLAKEKVDLVRDSHALVLCVVVLQVGLWVLRLPLDDSSHLLFLLANLLLVRHEILELLEKVVVIVGCLRSALPLDVALSLVVVSLLLFLQEVVCRTLK